jgi:hypothetical protein
MRTLIIKDLPQSRTLDHAAMKSVRGAGNAGGGGWVVGWIAPYIGAASGGAHAGGDGGSVFNISNTFFIQIINAAQANFQNQTTDVFNSGNGATIDVGTSQASAITRQ